MSSRVTRSAAKLAADPSLAAATQPPVSTSTSTTSQTQHQAKTRKRKVSSDQDQGPENQPATSSAPQSRQSKKRKVTSEVSFEPTSPTARRGTAKQPTTMGKPGYCRPQSHQGVTLTLRQVFIRPNYGEGEIFAYYTRYLTAKVKSKQENSSSSVIYTPDCMSNAWAGKLT